MLSIYGRSYLIYLIGKQIGANFTGESCKLCFKTIIGKIFSKKHPNPKTVRKSFFLFADVFEKITPNLVKPLEKFC